MRKCVMADLHQAIGGTAACRKLSSAFYARVKQDPLLRPLFPGKTLKCAIEEFAAFLTQFLGGPSEDAQRRWWLSLRGADVNSEGSKGLTPISAARSQAMKRVLQAGSR